MHVHVSGSEFNPSRGVPRWPDPALTIPSNLIVATAVGRIPPIQSNPVVVVEPAWGSPRCGQTQRPYQYCRESLEYLIPMGFGLGVENESREMPW